MTADIIATPPGMPRPRLDVHALASRPYTVDLSRILRPGEMLAGDACAASRGLDLGAVGIKGPALLSVHIKPQDLPGARPHVDHDLTLSARTTAGASVACTITVRAHA